MNAVDCGDCDVLDRTSSVLDRRVGSCAPSGLVITPVELYFGTLVVGESDFTPRIVTVTNEGKGTVQIHDVLISVGEEAFSLTGNISYPDELRTGESFDIEVRVSMGGSISAAVGLIEIHTSEQQMTHTVKLSARVINNDSWNNTLQAIYDDFSAQVTEEAYVRATADTAEAGNRLTLAATLSDQIAANYLAEQVARIAWTEAEVVAREQLNAYVGTISADLTETKRVYSDRFTAEAEARLNLGVSIESRITAGLLEERNSRVDGFSAEAAFRQALEATIRTDYTALIVDERTVRANGLASVASDILSLDTTFIGRNNTTNSRIDEVILSQSDAISAEAIRTNNLIAELTRTNGTIDTRVSAGVSAETSARVTAVSAETTQRNLQVAALETQTGVSINSAITTLNSTLSTADSALSTRISSIEADYVTTSGIAGLATTSALTAAVASEASARAAGDAAEASERTSIVATLRSETTAAVSGEATARTSAIDAAATSLTNARVSGDNALSGRLDTVEASYITTGAATSLVNAAVASEASARASGDSAETSARTSLATTLRSETTAAVGAEATARTNAINASATDLTTARVAGDDALSGRLSTVEASYITSSAATGIATTVSNAAVASEATARAAGDANEASLRTDIVATLRSETSSAVAGEAAARTSAISASASSLTSAFVTADSTIASSVSSLSTTVGGHTSTLSTYGSSIGGLQAKYGVTLNSNGAISGFQLNSGSGGSDFIVQADKLKFQAASGGTVRTVFGADSRGVTINGDLFVGTGRIVFDNGTFMRVQGTGFGSSNQFIDWYGPSMAITSCTTSNAISYMTTSGGAYFGGTLAAGILKNSAQTTSTVSNASILIGPFLTNGNLKTIVCSFEWLFTYLCNTGTGGASGGGATITVEKSTGSGWTTIGTLTAGTDHDVSVDGEPGIPDHVRGRLYASGTFTDSTGATTGLQYRATLNRTTPTMSGTSAYDTQLTQFVSIISTES